MLPRPHRSVAVPMSLLLGFSLALAGCKKGEPAASASPAAVLTVTTEQVERKPLARTLAMTGSVAAWDPLPIMPGANGLRLLQVLAEEGQTVAKGQLLAQLDDATQKAQLAQARARAASAEANLAKMLNPTRSQDLKSAQAAYDQALAQQKSAEDAYARFQQLRADGGVSEAEWVGRETTLASARASADQALQRLSLAKEGSRSEDIRFAEAQAAEARAAVASAEALLAQTRVVAPTAGLITKRDAHLGDVSAVGRALFTLVRDHRLQVEALVPESDMAALRVGQTVAISSDARPDLRATGRVRLISPAIDPTSRQGTVKIDLPVGSRFETGMFVRAKVELGKTATLAVPAAALVTRDTGSEVFVLDGATAKTRAVTVGLHEGPWVGISTGLKPGEQIVTSGVGFLKDGDRVDVAPAIESSPAANLEPAMGAEKK